MLKMTELSFNEKTKMIKIKIDFNLLKVCEEDWTKCFDNLTESLTVGIERTPFHDMRPSLLPMSCQLKRFTILYVLIFQSQWYVKF